VAVLFAEERSPQARPVLCERFVPSRVLCGMSKRPDPELRGVAYAVLGFVLYLSTTLGLGFILVMLLVWGVMASAPD
jgi:hypothetical protein